MTLSPNQDDFSRYGKHFQETLAFLLLRDRTFCDRMSEVIKEDYFETKYLKVFSNILLSYREKYKTHPSIDTMTTLLRTAPEIEVETEVVQKQVREFFARAYTENIADDAQYVMDTAIDFCRRQIVKEAMLKSIKLVQTSSFDEVSKVLNDALKAGGDQDDTYDYLLDLEKRFEENARSCISTGWKPVDVILGGGIAKQELTIVLARTNVGKSFVLVHLGAQALLTDLDVAHYCLEMSAENTALRYDSLLTDIPMNDLKSEKEVVRGIVSNIKGKLVLKTYPTKSATTQTIRNHLERLKMRGFKPDVVVVDYGDLLKSLHPSKEAVRHDLSSIFEELRQIAQIYDCAVVTASQSNRSASSDDLVTMESIAESYGKVWCADTVLSLSRNQQEMETNSGRLYIAKSRSGRANVVFQAFIDWSRAKIQVFDREQSVAASAQTSLEQQKLNLKKIYSDFRKETKGQTTK